jgi:hypothetical protein
MAEQRCSVIGCGEEPNRFVRGMHLCTLCRGLVEGIPDWFSDAKVLRILEAVQEHDEEYHGQFFADLLPYGLRRRVFSAACRSSWLAERVIEEALESGYRYPPLDEQRAMDREALMRL